MSAVKLMPAGARFAFPASMPAMLIVVDQDNSLGNDNYAPKALAMSPREEQAGNRQCGSSFLTPCSFHVRCLEVLAKRRLAKLIRFRSTAFIRPAARSLVRQADTSTAAQACRNFKFRAVAADSADRMAVGTGSTDRCCPASACSYIDDH